MNPDKFCQLIENEQKTHTGKCLYHLTKSHQSQNCAVKKECDRLLTMKRNEISSVGSNSSTKSGSTSRGQLRHLTEITKEVIDESVEDTTALCFPEELTNDTNVEVLNYFSHVSKHYLHLAKHNLDSSSRHNMAFPIIADSGANWHMFNDLSFFDDIQQASGKVILGDGITCVPIQGIGNIRLKFVDNITIKDVRYVPDLAESIYSFSVIFNLLIMDYSHLLIQDCLSTFQALHLELS